MPDKFQIAAALRDIALLLRFHGQNRFRAMAYEAAADAVETLREDLGDLIRERRLTAIAGIGPALAATIVELHETGGSRLRDRLREGVPRGVAELAELGGLGAKKILALHRQLGIEDVDGLRNACEAGVVRAVEGFGAKTEQRILEAIRRHAAREPGHLLFEAIDIGERLVEYLRQTPAVVDVAVAGSV
ncbi:MAG: helix-hairpin-helix domain-containing protein, partial [Candidatus Binatia bacterium]